jgi:DNA-binding MarR family transcriptional regulator
MEQKKEFTGIFIPKHIIEDEDLSMQEMIIYSEIACFNICYKTNEEIGLRWKLKERRIREIISRLKEKGYLEIINSDGRRRHMIAIKDDNSIIKKRAKCRADRQNNAGQTGRIMPGTYNEEDHTEDISQIFQKKPNQASSTAIKSKSKVAEVGGSVASTKRGVPTSEEAELIQYWIDKWTQVYKKKPFMTNWGRYVKNAKPFISYYGLAKCKQVCDRFFITNDQFYRDNKWSLIMFLNENTFNKLA